MRYIVRGAITLGTALAVVLVLAAPASAATAIEYGLIAAIVAAI
jgi:hypothetical protein